VTVFCKDCKHAVPSPSGHVGEFLCCDLVAPKQHSDYYVTGEPKFIPMYCSTMRNGDCGPEGKLYEAKA